MAKTLGADQIDTLMTQTGMSRGELIAGLSEVLPEVVDKLTPQGRVPTTESLSRTTFNRLLQQNRPEADIKGALGVPPINPEISQRSAVPEH